MSIRGLIDSVTGAEITDMDVAKTQIGVGNVSELSMTFSVSESAPSPVSGKVILYLSSENDLRAILPNGDIYNLVATKMN